MKPDLSIIPEREPGGEARKKLPPRWLAQLCIDQKGKCGCGCGQKLNPLADGFVDEHMIPLAAGGTNDLSNRRLLRPDCAKAKTKTDKGVIAKTTRMGGGRGSQVKKRASGKTKSIPSRKLEGGGFDKRYRKKFDGTVEKRT